MDFTSTDKGLLTASNCAVILINHQPQLAFGVASIDRQTLLNNTLILAKAAKAFGVPTILTTIVSKEFSGNMWPQVLDVFPDHQPIERTSLNAWDDQAFVAAVKATGRKNLVVAALWTEVCLVFPTLHAIWDSYNVFAVEDASGGMSETAHQAGIRRIEAAGAISVTAIQVLLEFQRDWARHDHYADAMEILKAHGGAYGQGVEYASTMLHQLPPSRHALAL